MHVGVEPAAAEVGHEQNGHRRPGVPVLGPPLPRRELGTGPGLEQLQHAEALPTEVLEVHGPDCQPKCHVEHGQQHRDLQRAVKIENDEYADRDGEVDDPVSPGAGEMPEVAALQVDRRRNDEVGQAQAEHVRDFEPQEQRRIGLGKDEIRQRQGEDDECAENEGDRQRPLQVADRHAVRPRGEIGVGERRAVRPTCPGRVLGSWT